MYLQYLCFFDCQVDVDVDNVQCCELINVHGVQHYMSYYYKKQ